MNRLHLRRVTRLVAGVAAAMLFGLGFCRGATEPKKNAPEVNEPEPPREVLIFADGDRTQGHLIGRDGDFLVFHSIRFGELRVPAANAKVEALPKKPEVTVAVAEAAQLDAARLEPFYVEVLPGESRTEAQVEVRRGWTSPAALTESLFHFLGPWKGRLGVTLSLTGKGEGRNLGADLSFAREWTNDRAKFEMHYYYADSDKVVSTDLLKGSGLLRHDFRGPFFVSYRPSVEWNRNYFVNGVESDYVLAQESVGFGVNLLDQKGRKIGLGIGENVFNLWTLDEGSHSVRDTQSLFAEFEFALPWRINASGRGTWYYSLSTGDRGWEDQFEITKKFSDTLSLGVRREARHNNPDERIADYSLLRLQLGLDF